MRNDHILPDSRIFGTDRKNKKASFDQFNRLVGDRISKVRELRKYIGQRVKYSCDVMDARGPYAQQIFSGTGILTDCNAHYLTLKNSNMTGSLCFPLSRVEFYMEMLGEDEVLKLEVAPPGVRR